MLAQSASVATSATKGMQAADRLAQLTLPAEAPLRTHYELDFHALQFTSPAEAQRFVNSYRDNYVSFELDYASASLRLVLHHDHAPADWTQSNWNSHLADKRLRVLRRQETQSSHTSQ